MKDKPKPKVPDKADDKQQSERFIETAREAELSDDVEILKKSLRQIAKSKPTKKTS